METRSRVGGTPDHTIANREDRDTCRDLFFTAEVRELTPFAESLVECFFRDREPSCGLEFVFGFAEDRQDLVATEVLANHAPTDPKRFATSALRWAISSAESGRSDAIDS